MRVLLISASLGAGAFALGLGTAGSVDGAPPPGPTRSTAADGHAHRALEHSTRADEEDQLCGGGQETAVTAEITAQSLSEESGGYTLDLDLDLTNRSDKRLRAITTFELVDDRGNIAVPAHIGPAIDLPERARASAGYTIPAGLAPGYYHLTVTTVAGESAEADHEDLITSYFVRVDDTGIVPISADDWHTMSNANEAFLLPEEEAP